MRKFTIRLESLRFYSKIGVAEQERLIGNEFEVDVKLIFDADNFIYEDLSTSVNYAEIYDLIKSEMEKDCMLLESVAISIATEIEKKWPKVEESYIKIRKVHPPITGIQGSASVEYTSIK